MPVSGHRVAPARSRPHGFHHRFEVPHQIVRQLLDMNRGDWPRGPDHLGDGIMLDLVLDLFGAVALFGQVALFLVYGQIEEGSI